MAPTSVAIDLGPLQQRNKREILGNMLNWPSSRMSGLMWPPLAKCLDLPVLAVNPGVEIQIPASIESYFRIWFGTRVGSVSSHKLNTLTIPCCMGRSHILFTFVLCRG